MQCRIEGRGRVRKGRLDVWEQDRRRKRILKRE